MPFIGPRRGPLRPPRILDNGSSPVPHRRPIVLVEAARRSALLACRARFRQPLIGLVLLDNGSSAVPHRRPLLVGLVAAQTTAHATVVVRFRQPVIPPFPTSNGTDARTAPRVLLVGLDVARPQARLVAAARHRQPFLPPFPTSDGTDARTQPRLIVGLAVALVAATARVRESHRPVHHPPIRYEPATADTSRTYPSILVGFPAATSAPVAIRAAHRQPLIGLVLLANGTDARTQPRPLVGLAVARATAVARARISHRPVWLPPIRREPATADTTISRPVRLVGFPAAALAPVEARLRHRQPLIPPFPISNGTDARTQPRLVIGLMAAAAAKVVADVRFRQPLSPRWPRETPAQPVRLTHRLLVGMGEAHRARLAARASVRQAIRPPLLHDDGSSSRSHPGVLLGTMQANLVAELRARQWSIRLGVPRREPATAVTSPGVVVTRLRQPQAVVTRTRTPSEVITRTQTR